MQESNSSPVLSFPSHSEQSCLLRQPQTELQIEMSDRWKPWPDLKQGLTVCEFFSGIGGFRLSLGTEMHGVPIRRIDAYDVSAVANEVYRHNFENTGLSPDDTEKVFVKNLGHAVDLKGNTSNLREQSQSFANTISTKITSTLHNVLIEGVQVADLDGRADVWTMSPPCQPYTTTRGAHQKDELDHRSGGLYHLMYLLRHVSKRPRYILLENVAGFATSTVLKDWKVCLNDCGYSYRQYLISPMDIGCPNHRKRYYMTIFPKNVGTQSDRTEETVPSTGRKRSRSDEPAVISSPSMHARRCMVGLEENVYSELDRGLLPMPKVQPLQAFCRAAAAAAAARVSEARNGGQTTTAVLTRAESALTNGILGADMPLDELWNNELKALLIPLQKLRTPWAASRVSVVGPKDMVSYCFTKSYGRLIDRASGSCYLPTALHRLADPEHAINRAVTDANPYPLEVLHGELRFFHPQELLALSGFPLGFTFPASMPIHKRFACIGNSVNVYVLTCIVQELLRFSPNPNATHTTGDCVH